ncbi:MAG: hypothetical protein GY811_02555 [Myxococcales bacterium]|nr:hypothetical protein [Myxococcales bacterium]
MILGALVIGAITAYYFGVRVGVYAAVASVGLFVLGIVMPSKLLWTYGLVGAFVVGVLVIGPRLPGRQENKADFLKATRSGMGKAMRLYRKLRR